MKTILTSLIIIFFTCVACRKGQKDPELFFRARVDGRSYRPDACANCITCSILKDSILIIGANRGWESLYFGISDRNGVDSRSYTFDHNLGRRANFKNSTNYNDVFQTDSLRTGAITITSIDRSQRIIAGNFGYTAFNGYRGSVVRITEGAFRLKYTTY